MENQIDKLGHIAVLCNKFEETVMFYTKTIGFEKIYDLHYDDGSLLMSTLRSGSGQVLEVFTMKHKGLGNDNNHSFQSLGIETDRFDYVIDKLSSEKIDIYRYKSGEKKLIDKTSEEIESVFFCDPEGNEIELIRGNNDGMLQKYISLKCNNYSETKKFYSEALGMELSDTNTEMMHYTNSLQCKFQVLKTSTESAIVLLDCEYGSDINATDYSFMHYCLISDDIVKTARSLESYGCTLFDNPTFLNNPYTEPYDGKNAGACGSLSFFVKDPEGNELEIMQYTANSKQLK